MKNRILKLFILILLPIIPFMTITNAQFYDTEKSSANSFVASSLDMNLTDDGGSEAEGLFFDKDKLKSDEDLERIINVVNEGSISFYYYPEFEFKNGEQEVCEALNLTAKKEGSEVYNGSLLDFDLATESAQITENSDEWEFELTHENDDENLQGEKCEFDIVFKAFQNTSQTGFSDMEKLSNSVGLAYEPELSVYHNKTLHKFIFTLSNLGSFTEFGYVLDYDTDTVADNANGSEILSGESSKTTEIDLGTQSFGVLTPHVNPHDFNLDIILTDIDGDIVNLSEQL